MQFYCTSSSITPTLGSGINHPDKSDDLAAIWTEIKQPTAADICQLLVNAQLAYGSELLHGIRIDIDDAYPRLLLHLLSVSLCAVLVVVDSVSYVSLARSVYKMLILHSSWLPLISTLVPKRVIWQPIISNYRQHTLMTSLVSDRPAWYLPLYRK